MSTPAGPNEGPDPIDATSVNESPPTFTVMPRVGDSIDDFDLLTELGRGSFATVFLARQRSMQRLVALKISRDSGEEHCTLAQLDHDHIVRVHDIRSVGELRLLYMQYVAGGTLRDVIDLAAAHPTEERNGSLLLEAIDQSLLQRGEAPPASSGLRSRLEGASWPEVVCWLGARLAAALHYAGEHGVLHRDVKPANVLLTAEGSPRLVDFNISYSSETIGGSAAANFGGSLAYMSPEHMDAAHPGVERSPDSLDQRSDVYSLGVLLWELLTTDLPFAPPPSGVGKLELREAMRADRAQIPGSEARAALPPEPARLEAILLRCLAPRVEDRFADGDELAQELQLCLHPQVQSLLQPTSWRRVARRLPTLTLAAATILPSAVAARFNYLYNRSEIIDNRSETIARSPEIEESFWSIVGWVNGVSFPLGFVILLWLTWPLARGLSAPPRDPEKLALLRRRSLEFSHRAAMIGIFLWAVAGLVYPFALRGVVDLPPATLWSHFVVSHLICALISASYPFFLITFLQLRLLYPAFVRLDWDARAELPHLTRLGRRSWLYLALAGVLPMFTLGILLASGSETRTTLATLSFLGFAGMAAITLLFRAIQGDISALVAALRSTSHTTDATLADPL